MAHSDWVCSTSQFETWQMCVAYLGKEGFQHEKDVMWSITGSISGKSACVEEASGKVEKGAYVSAWMRNNLFKHSTMGWYVNKSHLREERRKKLMKKNCGNDRKKTSFFSHVNHLERMWIYFLNELSRVPKIRDN